MAAPLQAFCPEESVAMSTLVVPPCLSGGAAVAPEHGMSFSGSAASLASCYVYPYTAAPGK